MCPQSLRASPPQRFTTPDSEEPLSYSPPESQSLSSVGKAEPHQAFVIEFFDDNSRKKRSQSFTNNASPPEPSGLRVQLEKARKSSSPTGERQVPSPASTTPPTQRYTIPLKGPASTGPQRAGSLRREKTEDRISTSFSSRSSSTVCARPFSSVGRRSKLAQEFTAEFLKQAKQSSSASWEKNTASPPSAAKKEAVVVSKTSPPPSNTTYQPQTSSPIHQPVPLQVPVVPLMSQSMEVKSPHVGPKNEEEDSLSDAGTYTIETDTPDRELEEARNKIDQVSIFLHFIYISTICYEANNHNMLGFTIHQCPIFWEKVQLRFSLRHWHVPLIHLHCFVPDRCSAFSRAHSEPTRVKQKRHQHLGL